MLLKQLLLKLARAPGGKRRRSRCLAAPADRGPARLRRRLERAPSEVVVVIPDSVRACLRRRPAARRGAAIALPLLAAAAAFAAFSAIGAAALMPDGAAAQLAPAAGEPPASIAGRANGGDSDIKNRLEGVGPLFVVGQRLHGALVRRFYAAHDWEPVWPSHPAQAAALLGAVLAAGQQGLDPGLFHAALLRNPAALSPLDRELVLSDAVLGYADALARGALPIEDRLDDEDLTPASVDIPAVVGKAIDSPDPAAVITALAPNSPAYQALRRALAAEPAAPEDRRAAARRRTIEVNLERLRWLPRPLPPDRVWVNTANARLVLYRDNLPVLTTRVIVGEASKQTPEFGATIDSVLFNPPWNIPPSIAAGEIMPKLSRDPDYLAEHYMVWRRNGALQQVAGPHSALGRLKFEMADRFDVYLHDTPERFLFARRDRRRSHGCVRVEAPSALAALLLDEPQAAINKEVALGTTHRRYLKTPMPVFIVYQTAVAKADGTIAFYPDVYDRDWEIWRRLHPGEPAPVAVHEPPSQRRG
jgi:L,D-transpeptidase YcbB